jgi:sporulation protein YlmC with PRC-barrel domain
MNQESERIVHTDKSTPFRRVMSASSLCQDSVRNRVGDEVGSIKEIMIDVPSGRIAYAVMSVGGFLGMGDRLLAIPWEALTLDEDRKCFVMDVDKRKLEDVPGFDKEHWPEIADDTWLKNTSSLSRDMQGSSNGGRDDLGLSQARDDLGIHAARHYDAETARFSDAEVERKAREAREAVEGPEGPKLREAEQAGKSRSKGDHC